MITRSTLDEALEVPNVFHIESSIIADGSGNAIAYQLGDTLPSHCIVAAILDVLSSL